MNNRNLTIFVDMDGVVADFDGAMEKHPLNGQKDFRPDLKLDFLQFEPIVGAIDGIKALQDMGHEVFFASTAPWSSVADQLLEPVGECSAHFHSHLHRQ